MYYTWRIVYKILRRRNTRTGATSSPTKILRVILDAKYEKAYLNRVTKKQCQHLIETQRNEVLKTFHEFEELFGGTLGARKTDPVYFKLKEDAKPIYLIPYPVPKVHK